MPPTTVNEPSVFAPAYVERVILRNFRGIHECTVEFETDLTLLVGRNNVGKSRILSAVLLALGGRPADVDDFTLGEALEPEIDIFIAPAPPVDAGGDDEFDDALGRRFADAVQTVLEDPVRERIAWRTHIRRTTDGTGARAESVFLSFDVGKGTWFERSNPVVLGRDHRQSFAADLVGTGRDLMEELGRRGSTVRRVLSDLEVSDEVREELEARLSDLGQEIVAGSQTLASISAVLERLDALVGSMGAPELNPLPIRLEELARSISIDLNSGNGSMPIRLHGSGSRSLASLQVQGVMYDRRLGKDGPRVRPHPVTLVEEPEAHLHPQAALELAHLLGQIQGQKIVSTHSAQLVTAVDPRCIRLMPGHGADFRIVDLGPAESDTAATHRAFRPSVHLAEMEKLRRLVERPFGELLFASALVIGDGASERSFLPVLLRHALKHRAHGVCVIDPESMASTVASAAVKFAEMVGIPWILFADSDVAGKAAVKTIVDTHCAGSYDNVIWAMGVGEGGAPLEGAFEQMLIEFDDELCREACADLGLDVKGSVAKAMKGLKGSGGATFAERLVTRYADVGDWPCSLRELVARLQKELP